VIRHLKSPIQRNHIPLTRSMETEIPFSSYLLTHLKYTKLSQIRKLRKVQCLTITHAFVLKKVKDETSLPVSMLVNKSLKSRIVPKSIKVVKVVLIYKSKAQNQFCNFRPLIIVITSFIKSTGESCPYVTLFILGHTIYCTRVSMALETVTQQPKR